MDGGARQNEMAERIKREVRANSHLRRKEQTSNSSDGFASYAQAFDVPMIPNTDTVRANPPATSWTPDTHSTLDPEPSIISPKCTPTACPSLSKDTRDDISPLGTSETVLLMFYLDHVLPFLLPFYQPPAPREGGRAWILEISMRSPTIRQAILCQSSFFFSLTQGTENPSWDLVLTQTGDVFGMLRQALSVVGRFSIAEHVSSAIRIMAGIMHVQRFEIAVLSFKNCQAHLDAASVICEQLLDSCGTGLVTTGSSFITVLNDAGSFFTVRPSESVQIPYADQAAFRFSSSLLILDDIVASTILQKAPRLYRFYYNLLSGDQPPLSLERVVGCQNWVLLGIAEISALDGWKEQCKKAGDLDMLELVRRAAVIKDSLHAHLTQLKTDSDINPQVDNYLSGFVLQSGMPTNQSSTATCIWAHAAFIYLHVVVSGWQPANINVRYHVDQVIELITEKLSPPSLLRALVWPLCVAGCLAEPARESHFRSIGEALQPRSIFGTVKKALDIMEYVWRNRSAVDAWNQNLATCLRSHGDLVLLV